MASLIDTIRESVIGAHHEIEGPFGPRLVTYADYTASGRSLTFIEEFLRRHVMPYYANTHTESSGTGLQTTQLREDARATIKRALGGTDDDVVIFTGSGATGAINKLVDILNLRLPAELDKQYGLAERIPPEARPVVFIGPYEHHSNELPWRESIAQVVVIDEDENGRPNVELLEKELIRYAHRPLRIGSFSAASNVTGIGSRTQLISKVLHDHGALAFWDFAAAGPYVQIELENKDAVFLSPHKFIGGPGTPGVLAVKKRIVTNRVPTQPGGGTVSYVWPTGHHYLADIAHREEGGTPDILGAIRAGLVFQLKEAVGHEAIRAREDSFLRRAIERWSRHDNIEILGNLDAWRLSILSFMVRHQGRYLHYNFVVTLLNDLFGIQSRGGCSCAGPYGHRLLHIDILRSSELEHEILRGCEGIKPGWARINFNYFISEATFEFILAAVEFVATEGWKFLPMYRFDANTALWHHKDWVHRAAMRLGDVTYEDGRLCFPHTHSIRDDGAYEAYLAEAKELAEAAEHAQRSEEEQPHFDADFEHLRWFPLPHEIDPGRGTAR